MALTPERLSIFLSNYDDFNVDLLVIDEIQKINDDSEYIIPYLQFPEILSTKKKNQIQIMNKKIQLTNFQKDRYEELNNGNSLAFSAPPSAGKYI